MRQFLEDFFGDELTPECRIAVFTTPNRHVRFFTDYQQLERYAAGQSPTQNVYFGLGLIRGHPKGRGKLADIAGIAALWCDIDLSSAAHPKENLPKSVDEAKSILADMPLMPSVIVASGHGLHAYWFLHEPWIFKGKEDRHDAASLAKRWHAKVCSIAAKRGWTLENLGDLTRVLRLPGTLNHNGADPVEVQVLQSDPQRRYATDDFEQFLPAETETASQADIGPLVLRPDAEPPAGKLLQIASSSPAFWETWNHNRTDLADQSQSGYDLSLATLAAMQGWSDQEIANLIIAARRHYDQQPQKALRHDYVRRTLRKAREAAVSDDAEKVDLSGILHSLSEPVEEPETNVDPGPIPEEMLRIPGFVSEVMDLCLATAPYPNQPMTFCGALALQAFLAGRKVCDPGDNRTNIYLLGLAHSSAGKDWIRKLNAKILHEIGLLPCLGDRLASGEGVQDALFLHPSMLFQTDEIDGILQSINKAKDARHEALMNTLLSLYSSGNSIFAMRPKAGKPDPGAIDQPCLVLFGTAIPKHFYDALSERMLTNGFFARQIVVEAGRRQEGQEPGVIRVSQQVLTVAKWWADFRPGTGNLQNWHPVPTVVEHTTPAAQLLVDLRSEAEHEYAKAEDRGDPVGTTVWGRVSEQARKLALIYAVSENHIEPKIGESAVQWASRFVLHQTRRMLYMASLHVSESEFDQRCKRLLEMLLEWRSRTGDPWMPYREITRRLRWSRREHDEVRQTLIDQERIQVDTQRTAGRPRYVYRALVGKKGS